MNGHSSRFGYGRVNAAQAVAEAARTVAAAVSAGAEDVAISGPDTLGRAAGPPHFTVSTGGRPFFVVEVATDPLLFDAANSHQRTESSFYNSLTPEGARSGDRYELPEPVWNRLRHAEQLAYRLISSAQADGEGAVYSTSDGNAADAKRITIVDGVHSATSPGASGVGSGSVQFPSGSTFDIVNDPDDDQDYSDPVANRLIPLVDTHGRLDEALSENFVLREFAARSGRYRYARISVELVTGLQAMRSAAAAPVSIRSAYRPQELNASVGGASRSQHLVGRAADIRIQGLSPIETAELALECLGIDIGLGLGRITVHVDLRGSLATWVYAGASKTEVEFDEWAKQTAARLGDVRGERDEIIDRDWPTVVGPDSWTVGSEPPAFRTEPGRNGWVAMEFAVDPSLFWPRTTQTVREPSTFAGTWEESLQIVGRGATLVVTPSCAIWSRLAGAGRIYYRALTFRANDGTWPNPESSIAYEQLGRVPAVEVQRTARDTDWVDDTTHRRRVESRWSRALAS